MEDDQMELFVWGSDWDLPSIDPQSIQVMAFVKFSGAPVTFTECDNPWRSGKGTIPFFKHKGEALYEPDQIITYLRQKNYNCDSALSTKEATLIRAYSQLIDESLKTAFQYLCWISKTNYDEIIRPCYGRRLPWLYKLWYPDWRLKREASKLITTLYPPESTLLLPPEEDFELNLGFVQISRSSPPEKRGAERFILYKAKECVDLLSDKLGTNAFFLLPNSPCALDALIYSYLAPFLKIPLPHCPVKEYITSNPNLEGYVTRITKRYFSASTGSGDTPAPIHAAVDSTTTTKIDTSHSIEEEGDHDDENLIDE